MQALCKLLLCLGMAGLLNSIASANETPPQTVQIYVTVDWEGWSLDDENIEAMVRFRQQFPHIPIMQLLNPVYLLRQNVDIAADTQKIRATFLPIDSYGLHIHGWKSLLDDCHVPYQSQPSYARENERCEGGECGYTVSLEYAYSQQDLTQLIACSAHLLEQQGFGRPQYFRAGGWQLGEKLAQALEVNQFTLDTSHTYAPLLTSKWAENSGLVQNIIALNRNAAPLDQPYPLTPHVVEYPNNASLADYTSTAQLLTLFKALLAQRKTVLVLGFHQETAFAYLNNLIDAIPQFEALAKAAGVKIEWLSKPIALPNALPKMLKVE